MRLVVLEDQYSPYRVPLYAGLDRSGVSSHVVFCSRPTRERLWRRPRKLPFSYEELDSFVVRRRNSAFPETTLTLLPKRLLRRLAALRPDVVVCYAYSVPTLLAALYCSMTGKPYVSWSEGTEHTEQGLSRLQLMIRKFLVPRAAGLIASTPGAQRRFKELGGQEATVVCHGADPALFRPATPRPISDSRPRVLYVGQLSDLKGIRYLLESFQRVLSQLPEAELHLVGEGPQRPSLEDKARQLGLSAHVRFHGHVDQRELATLYRATVFAFPTLKDTFGHVLGEALTSGCPIVSSPFAGAAEVFVRTGQNGSIVDPRNTGEFADALLRILSAPDLQRRMGSESLAISRDHSIEKAVDLFIAACARAAEGGVAINVASQTADV